MSRRERKKEETRGTIIDCAVSLFEEKGFNETSMEEIAEKSDVSKGTLYNYFQDKESILVGYFQIIMAEYLTDIKKSVDDSLDIEEKLFNILGLIKIIFNHHNGLAVIYFKHRMKLPVDINLSDGPHRSGVEKWVLEIIEEAQKNGQLRSDIPSLVLTRNFQFLAISFFISKIYTEGSFEIDDIRKQLIGLFLNGAKS